MKVTTNDLLAILRRFKLADETHLPRYIDQIKHTNPSSINQLTSFRFNKQRFYVLFDETAHDDKSYILRQLYTVKSDLKGTLHENPTSEILTYGLPFKGKDVYLFQGMSGKKRLDIMLAEKYPDTSRSTWQKHIKAGHVAVNDQLATSAKAEVSENDNLQVTIPESTNFSEHVLPIIYLDDHVIVVNKPAGVLTHTKGALNDEFTVADFFRRYTTVGLDTTRPGIVHRLDRDTSGIIIGARTPESFELLKRQFADRKAGKTYIAITDGTLTQPEALIDIPIGRNPLSPSTFRADTNGKSATTAYQVLHQTDIHSLVKLRPRTGRTHQLRVHLAHLGVPIHGDRVYGKSADRLYLHAFELEVTTAPETRMTFTAPVPSEFDVLMPGVSVYVDQA